MMVELQQGPVHFSITYPTWGFMLCLAVYGGWDPPADPDSPGFDSLSSPREPAHFSSEEAARIADAVERVLEHVPHRSTGPVCIAPNAWEIQPGISFDYFSGAEGRMTVCTLIHFARQGEFIATLTDREGPPPTRNRISIDPAAWSELMPFKLYRPFYSHFVSPCNWHFLLKLGRLGGWIPAGTVKDGCPDWRGSYVTHEGVQVTAEDALSLARAVENVRPDIPDEDAMAGKFRTEKLPDGQERQMLDATVSALEFFSGTRWSTRLDSMIEFLKGGAFRIELAPVRLELS